jgi:pimeloyl-ACP methyl ester carboxylesterase
MALINAATCYDRSKLATEGPAVAQLHPLVYPAGLLKLLPLLTDEYSLDQLLLILQAEALPSIIDDEIREAYLGRVAISLPSVLKFMPQETLRWRLSEWLETGCRVSRLSDFRQYQSFQTLIVAGERDGVLPSIDEAERLACAFPKAVVHVVDGAGHASTCGSRVDLAALFRSHFRELGRPRRQRSSSPRTAMKEAASAGKGKYFGMEPRYDGQTIGLSPLTYWSRKYYRKVQPTSANTNATKKATTE